MHMQVISEFYEPLPSHKYQISYLVWTGLLSSLNTHIHTHMKILATKELLYQLITLITHGLLTINEAMITVQIRLYRFAADNITKFC